MNSFARVTKKFVFRSGVVAAGVLASSPAWAAFTLPEMPVTQIEAAGSAVAALVVAGVLIGAVLRIVRKAG